MAFCRNCGAEIDDKAVICTKCGVATNNIQQIREALLPDRGGFGWGLLGFVAPLIGFILYLLWRDTKPKAARACIKGVVVEIIAVVVLFIIACFVLALQG